MRPNRCQVAVQSMWPAPGSSRLLSLSWNGSAPAATSISAANGSASSMFMWYVSAAIPSHGEPISVHSAVPGPVC